nr:hypothetical protein [Streptococcus equi]
MVKVKEESRNLKPEKLSKKRSQNMTLVTTNALAKIAVAYQKMSKKKALFVKNMVASISQSLKLD